MNRFASIAVLLLALCGWRADTELNAAPPPVTDMLQVVTAHYHAIEDNRIDKAMGHYHSRSPQAASTRENIEFSSSQFFQKTTTLSFCYIGKDEGFAIAIAKHRYLRISGIKFIEEFVDVVYRLREQQGVWKIWMRQDKSRFTPQQQMALTC